MTEAKTTATSVPSASGDSKLLVVEIGKKQKRKRIRDLAKGRGRLFERIGGIVNDLRAQGSIDANATPVVIVVRQRPRNSLRRFGMRM